MPKIIEGTWPENDTRRAFVEGAKWWEYYYSSGFTMWQSDQRLAEKEAEKRYKNLPVDKRRSESEIRKELASVECDCKNKKLEYLPYGQASASVMIMILKWVLNEGDEE